MHQYGRDRREDDKHIKVLHLLPRFRKPAFPGQHFPQAKTLHLPISVFGRVYCNTVRLRTVKVKMHLVRDLLLPSASFISIVSAICYDNGVPWPSPVDAIEKATIFCKANANRYLPPGPYISTCSNGPDGSGISYLFDIRNIENPPQFLEQSECVDAFSDLISCPFGGFFNARGSFSFQ